MVTRLRKETILVLVAEAKGALPIIESCAAAGLHVVAASEHRFCSGFYSHGADERFIYPSPKSDPDECVKYLLDLVRKRSIAALFPAGDLMTWLIAKHQDAFRKYTAVVLPPYDVFVQGREKILTLKAATRAGCPIPDTWYPQEQDLRDIIQEVNYPVLIKPSLSQGARGITICRSGEEVLSQYPAVEERFGDCFIQEFVPQTGVQYKVDAIFNHAHELLAGVVSAKLRYYPPTGGSSVINRTECRPDIMDSAVNVLKELKWVGFCDFDFITDPRDNVVKLIEINPRYPESYRATVAAGVDMTKIMYQLAKGESPAPQLEYQSGKYLRFLFADIMWFLTAKQDRWRSRPNWFDFFRSDTIYQLMRAHDWGPIMGYILQNLSMLWDKDMREFRLRFKNVKAKAESK